MKMLRSALQEGVGGGADKWQQTLHAEHRMNVFPDYPSHPGSWGSLCNWHILCAGILALNFNLICFSLIYLAEQEGSRYGQWKTENEKVKWTMLVKSPRSRCKAGSSGLHSVTLHEFGAEPKVFYPDLWIFRLEEARGSCPAEEKAHRLNHSSNVLIFRDRRG